MNSQGIWHAIRSNYIPLSPYKVVTFLQHLQSCQSMANLFISRDESYDEVHHLGYMARPIEKQTLIGISNAWFHLPRIGNEVNNSSSTQSRVIYLIELDSFLSSLLSGKASLKTIRMCFIFDVSNFPRCVFYFHNELLLYCSFFNRFDIGNSV
jgi:hypothetical protein